MMMKKTIALAVTLALCLGLLAACGGNNAPAAENTPAPAPAENTPAPAAEPTPAPAEPTPEPAPAPTGPNDLSAYLWEIPSGASMEEAAKLELRNGIMIQEMEPIFTPESYANYAKCLTSLRGKKSQEKLDAALAARAELVQVKSVAEGITFLWKDFDSMPIVDGESYTEEQLDKASLLGYGNTTLMVNYLIDDPTQAKGNIVMVSGGAMKGRSNGTEGYPAAAIFNELGYNVFLVQRRLEPYSTMDIYMDFQRAVRVTRKLVADHGWGGSDMIATCGWSGGGATSMGALRNCYGDITPAAYDSDYVPDEVDAISSDPDVAILIYGTYNHEGGGLLETENPHLPAMYLNHGTADSLVPAANSQEVHDALVAMGIPVELTMIEGVEHGYGVGGDGLPEACSQWPYEADAFMQANRGYSGH